VLHTALDTAGPNAASVIGTEGWVALKGTFYAPTSFTVYNSAGDVVEEFDGAVAERGMQFQAWEIERLIQAGLLAGEILPPAESVGIMGTLDEIRRQIGLSYPGE
jgi:hypothetical protein